MFWDNLSARGHMLSPSREFERLQREVNRLFSDVREPSERSFPAANVWTNQEGAIVSAELPGVDPDGLDISVMGNAVTINGRRDPPELSDDVTFHRRERLCGQFTRTLELPFRIQASKVVAEYKNDATSS